MVKTITVTEEAYTHLKELKQEDESFSKLIERFFHKKRNVSLDDVAGVISEEQGRELEQLSSEARKKFDASMKKRLRGT